MNIVILGGSGFIGSRLSRFQLEAGNRVVTVSRSRMPSMGSGHTHLDITLNDRQSMLTLLEDADFLFHLASDSTPGSSRLQPALEGINNILPTLQLLDVMQQRSRPCLVYVSSGGAIYRQDPDVTAFEESCATLPMSYYGAGKLAIEAFIAAYNQHTGQRALILRPSNIYGPGQQLKKQFGIVPTLFTALTRQEPFTIWGDGSAVRDFLFIDDFLHLCHRIIAHSWPTHCLETFNAGSGTGASINHLCELVEAVTGRKLEKHYVEPRGVDVPSVILNSDRAHRELRWKATTELQSGLGATWLWHQSNG